MNTMMKHFSFILKTAVLLCIFPMLWSCGDSKESTQAQPKVVSQKIVIQQQKKTALKATEKKAEATENKKDSAAPIASVTSAPVSGGATKAPVPAVQKVPEIKKSPLATSASDDDGKVPETGTSAEAEAKTAPEIGDKAELASEESTEEEAVNDFVYNSEGKTDPFLPLFREETASKEEPEPEAEDTAKKEVVKKKRRIPRTPLERMDLSQLKLVAIIRAESGNHALVQDAAGKGYVLNTGTYIGLNAGIVKQIEKDKVIVEEEVEDVYGKSSLREREMILQKPLGEI